MLNLECGRSLFGGKKGTKVMNLPLGPYEGGKGFPVFGSVSVDSTRKITWSFVASSVSTVIGNIFGVSNNSQVGKTIVSWVAIDVVNNHPGWDINPIHFENNSVACDVSFLPINQHGEGPVTRLLGGGLKVCSTSFLAKKSVTFRNPVKFPGLWIVSKLSMQILRTRQFLCRLHSILGSLEFRRIWRVSSPDAPSLYNHMATYAI